MSDNPRSVKDLLAACWRVGVEVTSGKGDEIKVSPAGKLSRDLKAELKENKERVLHVLRLREVYKKIVEAIGMERLIAMDRAAERGSDLWPGVLALDNELCELRDAGEISFGEFREKCEGLAALCQKAGQLENDGV